MSTDGLNDAEIGAILRETRRIALVGASNNPARPSSVVMRFLLNKGYGVTPVNPGLAGGEIHGQRVVASLDDAGPLDMVEVFRASSHLAGVMDDAIRLRARTVWAQLGVVDQEAACRGRAAGLRVVMDRCPVIEWPKRAEEMNG